MLFKKLYPLLLLSSTASAHLPEHLDLRKPPPKVIRTCCAFGVDVKVTMVPFKKMTNVTAPSLLGPHHYLGNKVENNGIIYSKKGGFLDLGHLRDIADITAFYYALIKENRANGIKDFVVGREAGLKTLNVTVPESFNENDLILLAGRIAYDLSVWHEISTWYGASLVPLIPERYSSFSVEDAYSNLLGVHLSMQALRSGLDFEEQMTKYIAQNLIRLRAVDQVDETKDAMIKVKDVWWSGKAKFPSVKLLIKRQFDILDKVSPVLLEEDELLHTPAFDLDVPEIASNGTPLIAAYTLNIKYNGKIPAKKIFGTNKPGEIISQRDFPALINYAEVYGKWR